MDKKVEHEMDTGTVYGVYRGSYYPDDLWIWVPY